MIIEKEITSSNKEQLIEITALIKEEVNKLSLKEGIALVFVPHTTAAITINENADPDVKKDLLSGLSSLKFENIPFKHAEGNSPAHLKTLLTGNSVQLIIQNNQILLGTWQGIFFCEFDGPRNRKFFIQIHAYTE